MRVGSILLTNAFSLALCLRQSLFPSSSSFFFFFFFFFFLLGVGAIYVTIIQPSNIFCDSYLVATFALTMICTSLHPLLKEGQVFHLGLAASSATTNLNPGVSNFLAWQYLYCSIF
ncbi:hypothetical protein LOK49_LG06G00168 [Camellia lanceoleosa]|uniref:Uncharacterized protein n=1 Tax=Camellia lanceoleosa TaxID=1840588 RepID=A0ACC0HBH0_9ERIC|nr:hypothetical protein LOK49_LG06G00168 [Camellia lanceoleosa]